MEILDFLIPKYSSSFTIPEITLGQTIAILDKLPSTSSVGHDDINNKFLKKIKYKIVPHLQHLINSIIRTKIFPKIYKLTRILPLSQSMSDTNFIENYRPVCNLCCIEKVIEQYILLHLEKYLNDNNILNTNLHGGRKKHSTQSAITEIYHHLLLNKEQKLTSVILATDLSAAYDTIDMDILINKMSHYGIGGNGQNFLDPFYLIGNNLSDWTPKILSLETL